MKKLRNLFIALILILGLSVALPATAEMNKKREHGKSSMGRHEMKHGKGSKMGHQSGSGAGHIFGPLWKETLTDEQKMKADRMHRELKMSLNVLKAKKKVGKAELNNLIIKDNPNTNAIHRKIDEILELKRKIMRIKYGHKVEMRGMLTSEQRVSFDMGLLKKTGHSKGRKHHK